MPRIRSVSDVKANLLRPALTSHYEVFIGIPSRDKNGKSSRQFVDYLSRNKITWTISQDKIHLSCSEALLPGSSFATHELTGDRTGVTERHIYRRVYDDRIDLTFYIDINPKDPYVSLRFFETWMKFVTNESIAGTNSVKDENFYYRVKYPVEYYGYLKITKFERTGEKNRYKDLNANLTYNFVGVFPTAVSSMPISYESSQLLKVTVSFSYLRYYIDSMPGGSGEQSSQSSDTTNQALTPAEQAIFNNNKLSNSFYTGGTDLGANFSDVSFGNSSDGFGNIPTWALSGQYALGNGGSNTGSFSQAAAQENGLQNRGIVSGGTIGGINQGVIGNTPGVDSNVG